MIAAACFYLDCPRDHFFAALTRVTVRCCSRSLPRNGSASYKALGFALISTAIYIILGHWVMGYFEILPDPIIDLSSYDLLDHPYPVAVIISSFLFVLSAKVTLSYNRVSTVPCCFKNK